MSQEIYVIRHCESQANVDLSTHFRMTNADVELTPEGELQNEQVAVELIGSWDRSRRASYKVLFSSPFKRTRRMVDVLASKMKEKKISYSRYEDILLSEQNWGHAIGHNEMDLYLQQESCSLPFDRQKYLADSTGKLHYIFPQGESLAQMALRAQVFLCKVQHILHAIIVVISHKNFCGMLEQQISGCYASEFSWHNGEIRRYSLDVNPSMPALYSKTVIFKGFGG